MYVRLLDAWIRKMHGYGRCTDTVDAWIRQMHGYGRYGYGRCMDTVEDVKMGVGRCMEMR